VDQAFPVKLIQDMVKFRIKENEIKVLQRKEKNKLR
jgi:hypothetical protein